jgi:parallel beta-helix repeat protein
VPLVLASAEASAEVPAGCIPPPPNCPAPNNCIEVTSDYELPPCNYEDVTFYVAASGTEQDPLVFDCLGQTIHGSHATETAIELHSHEGEAPLEHVLVQNCTVDGFHFGIKVHHVLSSSTRSAIRETYEDLAYEPILRDSTIAAIEANARASAPQNIRFDNVHVRNADDVGFYIFARVHDVTFENGSTNDNGGPGIYLDTGSRLNVIRNNDVSGNGREGVAVDSSAFNFIINNSITSNDGGGVRLYRNFWENADIGHLPRVQHAFGNVVSGNAIVSGGDPAVWVGLRQSLGADPGDWNDPVYLERNGELYYRENAELNVVSDNVIATFGPGIVVYDDLTTIVGNEFANAEPGIVVGNNIRRYAGEPVYGTLISDNNFGSTSSPPVVVAQCAIGTSGSGNVVNGSPYAIPNATCPNMRTTTWAHHATPSGFQYKSSSDRLTGIFTSGTRAITGHFDDDEDTDLVLVHGTSDGRARITLHLSTGNGFEHRTHYQWFPNYHSTDRWLAGDVDGDGKDDLVRVYDGPSGLATARVHYSRGNEFAYHDTPTSTFGTFDSDHQWLMGDFTGDGKDDLVWVLAALGSAGPCYALVMGSNGSAFSYFTSITPLANYWPTQKWRVGDFDGDEMDDLVNIYGGSGTAVAWVHHATGSGFEYQSTYDHLAGFWDEQKWLVTDFNADGKDDLVNVYGNSGDARAWRHASTGSGFQYQTGFQVLAGFFTHQRWVAGDFNGDGWGDLLDVYGASGAW